MRAHLLHSAQPNEFRMRDQREMHPLMEQVMTLLPHGSTDAQSRALAGQQDPNALALQALCLSCRNSSAAVFFSHRFGEVRAVAAIRAGETID